MADHTDITGAVLSQSNLPAIIARFREKARAYSLVRDASLQFHSIEGARASQDRFVFRANGEANVEAVGLPNLRLEFSGLGEYRREERRLYLTEFKILNDMAGIANKLIEVTGVGIGRSLHVNENDDALIEALLAL